MEPLAALAKEFGPACNELLSDNGKTKGGKKFNKIITCLLWVEQKVPEEVKRRTDSNCSETSITADLKPLDGELAGARSLISDWRNKNCLGKWWAAKEFKKKLEKSEEAIYQRLREFSSYTDRYEAIQHTKPVEETMKSIHLQDVSFCTLSLNSNQGSITIQPCNEHPHPSRIMNNGHLMEKKNNGHLMEKKNQNQLRMEKENNVHRSPMEKANQNQNQLRMEKENNVHLSPMEKANQNQNQLRMEKANQNQNQLRMEKANQSPMEKANQNQNQLRMEKANQSPMERGKVHPDHEGNPGRPQTQQPVLQEGNPGRPQTQQAVSQEKKEFEDRVGTVIFIVCLVLVVITIWTVITK